MGQVPLVLRRGAEGDLKQIIGLIDGAADWLRTKNTDQWAQPWPSKADRDHRIRTDLLAGKTWIAWDGGTPCATVTADVSSQVWPPESKRERAVYLCRLVVSRSHGGRGIGARLIDWAGSRARRRLGADWVRIDVWTTNTALHAYYRRQGFEFYGFCEMVGAYPSAALFQKPTAAISPAHPALFEVESAADR